MGRSPCCAKVGLNRGAWTATEDKVLTDYIKVHGEGKWRNLPKKAGLKRCGKSCRLRWLNYLRPDIKRGNITIDEEELIVRLHKLLGNRWSLIAGRLPGRTDNEIKNYWNTKIGKKFKNNKEYRQSGTPSNDDASRTGHQIQEQRPNPTIHRSTAPLASPIRTKASRCRKVIIPQELLLDDGHAKQQIDDDHGMKSLGETNLAPNSTVPSGNPTFDKSLPVALEADVSSEFLFDFQISEQFLTDILDADFSEQVDNFPSWASSSTDDNTTFEQVGLLSPSPNSSHTLLASDNILHEDDLNFPTVASVKDAQTGLDWSGFKCN